MKPYGKQEWKDGFTPDSWSEYQSFIFWSKVIGLIFLGIFLLPFLAHADTRHHRHPNNPPNIGIAVAPIPISAPEPQINSGYCWNFGHDILTNMAQVTAELTQLKQYSDCIRLAYNGWNNPLSEADALLAKSMGIRVIIGGDASVCPLSQESEYEKAVLQEAQWAQANGIPQISIGNEAEYQCSDVSQLEQWFAYTLAPAVKAVYSGEVSYETSSDFMASWESVGRGNIDTLGWNAYCGYGCNSSRLESAISSFGVSHTYISETNCDIPNQPSCSSDAGLAKEVASDAVQLHENFPSIPIYLFTWASNGAEVQSYWGLNNDPLTLSEL